MRKPARAGQRRLIRLESSTFMIAMAAPARIVPGNSATPGAAARTASPSVRATIAANSIRSSPSRRASAAAKPETTPKHRTGVAARTETVAVEMCRVDSSSGKIGGRLAIAVRRLKPSATTPTTSSVCSSRACAVGTGSC